jgi:hypothetical protein
MLSILMLMIASMAALAGMTACGSASSAPAAAPQTQSYTVTITGTSGAYSQSATVVLLVQ